MSRVTCCTPGQLGSSPALRRLQGSQDRLQKEEVPDRQQWQGAQDHPQNVQAMRKRKEESSRPGEHKELVL